MKNSIRTPNIQPTTAIIILLTLFAFGARLWSLLAIPDPFGTDGYYYVVQTQRYWSTGHFHVPDASWVLRFLALAVYLTGNPIVGVKTGAAGLIALAVPSAYSLEKKMKLPGMWLAVWAASSPTLGQLAAEFPKNGGACVALLCVGASLIWWTSRTHMRFAVAAAWVLVAATAHRRFDRCRC